jgi:predicted small metal-binding protein
MKKPEIKAVKTKEEMKKLREDAKNKVGQKVKK